LVLDGAEDVVDDDFEWCELLFFSIGLCLVPKGFSVDGVGSPILTLLGCCKLWLRLFPLTTLFRGTVGYVPGSIFNLDVVLDPKEDVPHFSDFVFNRVLVKKVGDLQLTNECCRHIIFITVMYLSHLALVITDVVLEAIPKLHLDGEKVIIDFLEFMSGSKLIKEGLPYLLKVSKE